MPVVPEKKAQLYPNCFIGCPYLFQCGVMVARGADSCKDGIKNAIPGAQRLEAHPLDRVDIYNASNQKIATVNHGSITVADF